MWYSLLYGAEDPSIAGMVLDSAFTNLYDLMMELVDVYKIRVPKFTVCSAHLIHTSYFYAITILPPEFWKCALPYYFYGFHIPNFESIRQ